MRDRSDLELARRVRAGCDNAAGELFHRHHSAMVRYARTLTTDAAVAEDLAAEAFERTLQRVRNGAVPQSMRAYLTAAVRNSSVDEYRRTNRLSSLDACDPNDQRITLEPAPLDFTARLADRDQLRQAFAALTPRHRLVLWRTMVEGRALAEVGAELDISTNAAAALVHRARGALRHAFDPNSASA
jgi:RNA polymerase sigma factor (sigma-70 family)